MPKFAKRQIQYAPKSNINDQIDEAISDALAPESLTFTYNANKTVAGIDGATTNLDFTYNPNKTVNTIDDQTYLRTFSYNANGTVDQIIVS